jgi:hypothetical protein
MHFPSPSPSRFANVHRSLAGPAGKGCPDGVSLRLSLAVCPIRAPEDARKPGKIGEELRKHIYKTQKGDDEKTHGKYRTQKGPLPSKKRIRILKAHLGLCPKTKTTNSHSKKGNHYYENFS